MSGNQAKAHQAEERRTTVIADDSSIVGAPSPGQSFPPEPEPRSARHAQWALALSESGRALRHPAVVAALLLYAALWAYEALSTGLDSRYPVLQDEDRYTQMPLLLLAAGALLTTHMAMTRMHRHGAEPLCEVLTLPPWRQTLAHLVAILPLAVLAAFVTLSRIAYYALAPTAVGTPSPVELATGPAVVVLAGCTGAALARFTTAVSAGPFAVLLFGALVLCSALEVRGMKWLGPLGVESEFAAPLPMNLRDRPALTHLVYLAAVSGLLALIALVRAGLRTLPARGAVALLAVAAVVAGAGQYRSPSESLDEHRTAAEKYPGDQQRCRRDGKVTFCAFPEFQGRTKDWRQVTDGILRRVPDDQQNGPYAVRQRLFFGADREGVTGRPPLEAWAKDDARHHTPSAVTVGTQWGTDEIGGDAMLSFAVRFSARVVVDGPARGGEAAPQTLCRAPAVTVLWLAAQATPETAEALRSLEQRSIGGVTLSTLGSSDSLSVNGPEAQVVRELLDRPADEVGDRLKSSWDTLVDDRTSTKEAAELMGASVPEDSEQGSEDTACAVS
ncbi:hypothetical protein [Streptomyces botrytidirepellens]|uniref:Uncharacterized protein n=1 Tax=Streptomyces botrytidirepellens TaxID=2486417 RepID=A0A3M8VP03_9ACTN|nr:hypothetical protein [Streptomyces botrytidirepellens]RNG18171.1 hypothetical protein EEJ42_27650 [Streptomyces botrytidirepellens]